MKSKKKTTNRNNQGNILRRKLLEQKSGRGVNSDCHLFKNSNTIRGMALHGYVTSDTIGASIKICANGNFDNFKEALGESTSEKRYVDKKAKCVSFRKRDSARTRSGADREGAGKRRLTCFFF